jgi:hypothetical protein
MWPASPSTDARPVPKAIAAGVVQAVQAKDKQTVNGDGKNLTQSDEEPMLHMCLLIRCDRARAALWPSAACDNHADLCKPVARPAAGPQAFS